MSKNILYKDTLYKSNFFIISYVNRKIKILLSKLSWYDFFWHWILQFKKKKILFIYFIY